MTADLHARQIVRDQGACDAAIDGIAKQVIGIFQLERQANQRRDRCQGDVTLIPIEAQPEYLFTVPHPAFDDAGRLRSGGIRAGFWARQREARNLATIGQSRQITLLLFIGTVMHQQFAGTERVGHHHRYGCRDGAAGDARHHARMSDLGKAQAAELFGNYHAEETFVLEKIPHLGRQIAILLNLPVVEHLAQMFDGAIHKRLLFLAQWLALKVGEVFPIRRARENLRIPPHRARFQCNAFGVAQLRHHFTEHWQ